jgi:uncharacterized damage-inducible protein DinB
VTAAVGMPVAGSVGVADEKAVLMTWLQHQRDSVMAIVGDLDPELARASVVRSGWTPAALVEHLCGAELFWVGWVLSGRRSTPEQRDEHQLSLTEALALYRWQAAASDELLAVLPLDARPVGLDQPGLPTEVRDVREVLLHLIEETARHAGHLDIARELLDGRTGLGPR